MHTRCILAIAEDVVLRAQASHVLEHGAAARERARWRVEDRYTVGPVASQVLGLLVCHPIVKLGHLNCDAAKLRGNQHLPCSIVAGVLVELERHCSRNSGHKKMEQATEKWKVT